MPEFTDRSPIVFHAPSDEGEVDTVGSKAMLGFDPAHQVVDLSQWEVDGAATDLADEVMVCRAVAHVDHTRSMPEVDMVDAARLLEHLDDPIDGRRVDVPTGRELGPAVQILGREMVLVRRGKNLYHRLPGSGDPEAFLSQLLDQGVGRAVAHPPFTSCCDLATTDSSTFAAAPESIA